jgi:NADPH-dependent 2,4-dienoyl-CoA reductase/sulfur reductase-like enzyme
LKGLETTIIEIGPSLLGMAVDLETSSWVTEHFRQQGVHVLTKSSAAKFVEQNGRVAGVETSAREEISCDFAAVGVGITPNVDIAKEAGLPVDNGIVVNDRLEVNGSGVFAAGDVARFYSPIFGKHLRVEHYDVAVKHGKVAGANMAGGQESFNELPYFFSFMFKLRIEVWGHISPEAKVVRRGQLELTEKGGFAQFYVKDDMVDAYLSVNRSFKEAQAAQKLILSRRQVQVSSLQDEKTDLSSLSA